MTQCRITTLPDRSSFLWVLPSSTCCTLPPPLACDHGLKLLLHGVGAALCCHELVLHVALLLSCSHLCVLQLSCSHLCVLHLTLRVIWAEETVGPKMFKLLTESGKAVQKKGKNCNLEISVSKTLAQLPQSRVQGAWQVTLHKADQIPNMDKQGPEWGLNFTGAKSDGFGILTGKSEAGSSMRTSSTHWSKCCLNTNHPVWEETFEFALCSNDNIHKLFAQCGIPPATPQQLNLWSLLLPFPTQFLEAEHYSSAHYSLALVRVLA